MSNSKIVICALASCLVLASCQTNKTLNQGGATASKLTPANDVAALNGKWIPSDKKERSKYYNVFKDGKFFGRRPSDDKAIAVGTYKYLENGDIRIDWFSETQQNNVFATCKKLSEQALQCTSGSSVFNLQRA